MNTGINWQKAHTHTYFFKLVGALLSILLIIVVVSSFYFLSISYWIISLALVFLVLMAFGLQIRALLFFRKYWCTHAAISEDKILLRFKDGSIRQIPWKDVSRIKMITKGSRLTGGGHAQIIKTGEKYDYSVVTGDAAITLYEEWMRRKGGF